MPTHLYINGIVKLHLVHLEKRPPLKAFNHYISKNIHRNSFLLKSRANKISTAKPMATIRCGKPGFSHRSRLPGFSHLRSLQGCQASHRPRSLHLLQGIPHSHNHDSILLFLSIFFQKKQTSSTHLCRHLFSLISFISLLDRWHQGRITTTQIGTVGLLRPMRWGGS